MQQYCILLIFAKLLQKEFMIQKLSQINLDILGFVASLTCAIHCAALPLVLAIGAAGGISWISDPDIELAFLVATVIIASVTLYSGLSKGNMGKSTLVAFALGFTLLLVGQWLHPEHIHPHGIEFLFSALGGVAIATAHTINWFNQRKRQVA